MAASIPEESRVDDAPKQSPAIGGRTWGQGALIVVITACAVPAGLLGFQFVRGWLKVPMTPDQIERLANRQSWAEAEVQIQRYLARNPSDPAALMLWGRVLGARRAYIDCAQALEAIREDAPERALALLRAGHAWQEGRYRREAERAWKACLEMNSGELDLPAVQQNCRAQLCGLYAMERRRDELWSMTESIMERAPSRQWHEPLAMRARYEFEMVDPPVALGFLAPALENDQKDLISRRAIGLYHLEAGNTEKARSQLFRCLQDDPDNLLMIEAWLQCLHKTGAGELELESAIGELPAGADRSAECWKARQNLAERQDKLELALEAADNAIRLDPSEPEYFHRSGQLLMRLGKKEEGQERLNHAQELQSARQELRQVFDDYRQDYARMEPGPRSALAYRFGQAYERLGRQEDAARWYRVGLSEDPAHQLCITALERLEASTGSDLHPSPTQK